jgi:hypothetical protein
MMAPRKRRRERISLTQSVAVGATAFVATAALLTQAGVPGSALIG